VRELFENSICVNECYMSVSENPSTMFSSISALVVGEEPNMLELMCNEE